MPSNTLFFFDLDGTVTAEELLPLVARETGHSEQLTKLIELTVSGQIPFAESFRQRVELLKTVPIEVVNNIIKQAKLHSRIVAFIKENKDRCFIVTGNLDVWVSGLCDKLGCRYFASKAIVDKDTGALIGAEYVLEKHSIANSFSLPFAAVGEGHNDAEMIRNAQVGIAFGAVHMPSSSVLECAGHCVFEEETLCRFLKQLL